MTKLEARRNIVLDELGWLGMYTYEELGVVNQLYVNGKVDEMTAKEEKDAKRKILLEQSYMALTEEENK
jgi:hypothetical protein